jgi:transcriptional regulator with PAS, ATPase and Fis domain
LKIREGNRNAYIGYEIITGDSGTGKHFIAHALHAGSPRIQPRFVHINCATIPKALFESEVFGSEPGAFTGAHRKSGYIEEAESGTLFLDEIGCLPFGAQAKLLRIFDDGKYRRLGGLSEYFANVRIIAATNRDLQGLVDQGKFHGDLFYRLDEARVDIPPLCERKEDIVPLIEHFLRIHKLNPSGEIKLRDDPDSLSALRNYPWPGNARQVRNVVGQLLLKRKAGVSVISTADILKALPISVSVQPTGDLNKLELGEKLMIEEELLSCDGKVNRAAMSLGLPRTTLAHRMKKLGIPSRFGKL